MQLSVFIVAAGLAAATPPPPSAEVLLPADTDAAINSSIVIGANAGVQTVTVTDELGADVSGTLRHEIGDVWIFEPDAVLDANTTYDVEIDLGGGFSAATSFGTGASSDAQAPTGPSSISETFETSYHPDIDQPLPGNEGLSAWWRTSVQWSAGSDDGAIVYGLQVSDYVSPESGQDLHTSSTSLELLLPMGEDVAITVCAIDTTGAIACDTSAVTVPGVNPGGDDNPGACSCAVGSPKRLSWSGLALIGLVLIPVLRRSSARRARGRSRAV